MALEREMETYRRELPGLLARGEGKMVLIFGDQVEGVFETRDDALRAGYDRFGLVPLLVKEVRANEEPVVMVTPFLTRHADSE
jgi:hypothetical protein